MRGLRHRAAVERLGLPGAAGSAAFHCLLLASFLAAGAAKSRPRLPPVYRVTLVAAFGTAPAAAAPGAATPPAAAASRAPTPAPPRAAPRARTPAVPARPPARQPPAPPARTPAPTPQPATAARPAPPAANRAAPAGSPGMPTGSPGGSDVATIKTEGVDFPFPGYLHNLVAQVYRRWSPPSSNARLEAEIFFLVQRDGTVTGLQFVRRSGSFAFDLEAQGALEAAARAGAFGALPAGYGANVLPVSFYFNPGSAR
ncbi:MAG TPA: TonB C-terminal domain-containing protein [Gemmatimonadales bacterium]|nr:TonB C-terminal domain-containing protein [Gemmatimonadales bacterium]